MDTRTGLPVVGMIGGGPLARMMAQAAIALGQSLRVFPPPEGGSALGPPADVDAFLRFAEGCDVVTVDPAHVPHQHVRALAARGVTVHPGADALGHAQDRRVMRERLTALGVRVVPLDERARRSRDLAAVVARSPWGQAAAYPVVQTVRRDGVAVEVLAPAPGLDEDRLARAQQLAIRIATAIDAVGVTAVELLDDSDIDLVVSELTLGPRESGHWTIEGARTSQFEQHLRAVLDYPLGETRLTAPAVATATVLGGQNRQMGIDERLHHLFADDPGARVHLYAEPVRSAHTIGHVTVLGDDPDRVRERARRAARWLADGPDTSMEESRHD